MKVHNLATGLTYEVDETDPIKAVKKLGGDAEIVKGKRSVACGDWAAAYNPLKTYDVNTSEYCAKCPDTITLDPTQFRERVIRATLALESIDMDYGKSLFQTGDYEADREEPYGYEPSLKVYKDGDVQLLWEDKNSLQEYWVDIPSADILS